MDRVRIGLASFAHMHQGSYASGVAALPDAEIAAVWDADPERGKKMASRFGAPYVGELDSFLDQDMAGVIVCTENARHIDVVIPALEAGKHVLCEKPLAASMEDCRAMLEAGDRSGLFLGTAFPCRFSPAMLRLRDVVKEGKLGDIIGIAGTNRGSFPGGWFVELDKSGGGAVIDHTVHVTDLVRWMLGAEVTSVYAEISNTMYESHFDDCGMLMLEFDNGVFASLDTSWTRTKSFPFWGDVTMEVVGSKGVASMDMFNQKMVVFSDEAMKAAYRAWGSSIDYGLVAEFVSICRGAAPVNIASALDGMKAAEVALAAYRSADAGGAVALPLA